MDYGRLNRKELQALCKEHGIPANKTNVCMAEALGALLNKPKDSQQSSQSVPDPAEIVKEKAERTVRSRRGTLVLQAGEVDDLSSQLAKSTLAADSSELSDHAEAESEGLPKDSSRCAMQVSRCVPVDSVEDPSELREEPENVTEAVKVPRRSRTKTSKAYVSINSLVNSTPALVEPTFEVVLPSEDLADSLAPEPPTESGIESTYSRRAPKVKEQNSTGGAGLELTSASIASVPSSEEDIASVPSSEGENVIVGTVAAKTVTKKTTAKGKRSKKGKSVPAISILEDLVPPPTDAITSAASIPDSPTLGLTCDPQDIPLKTLRAVSLSPAPEDGFEFKPVPESLHEIMTPGKPLVEATKGCLHRGGRKSKSCKSCASEKTVDSLINEVRVLQAIVNTAPIAAAEPGKTEVATTPVTHGDGKENSLKNIDLHSCSIRTLQKEARRVGLGRRNNTRSVGAELVQQ